MDEARYRELLEEATIDCYDEEEQFWSVVTTLQENVHFPLRAEIVGVEVAATDIAGNQSSLRRGIVAEVNREGQAYTVSLLDLSFLDADAESAEWLEMAQRWSTL